MTSPKLVLPFTLAELYRHSRRLEYPWKQQLTSLYEDLPPEVAPLARWDPDGEAAWWPFPNPPGLIRQALAADPPGPEDVILDLGAGDGRLALAALSRYGCKETWAIELNPTWTAHTRQFFAEHGFNSPRFHYLEGPFQEWTPPPDAIRAYFLAKSCGPKMLEAVREWLKGTRVRTLVHNFGMDDTVTSLRVHESVSL